MPLTNPGQGNVASLLGALGLMAVNPSAAGTGYAARSITYTPNAQSAVYSGGLLNLLDAARVADLNALRVAVENQRVLTEALASLTVAMRDDLKRAGIIAD